MNASTPPRSWPGTRPAAAQLTILGLGPGPVEALSLEAWEALAAAPRILLRTARHPCVPQLPNGDATDHVRRFVRRARRL